MIELSGMLLCVAMFGQRFSYIHVRCQSICCQGCDTVYNRWETFNTLHTIISLKFVQVVDLL